MGLCQFLNSAGNVWRADHFIEICRSMKAGVDKVSGGHVGEAGKLGALQCWAQLGARLSRVHFLRDLGAVNSRRRLCESPSGGRRIR